MKAYRQPNASPMQSSAGISRLSLIIVIVAVAAIAVAAWFYFLRTPDSAVEQMAPPPPTSKQARPDSARDVINSLKENTPVDYASAFDQAEDFRDDGELADAQLLYFFAARGGNGPAAFALAEMYDPVNFDASKNLMDEPDAFQAWKWYQNALEAGEATATERLTALRTWAERAAADGDLKAEQLLLQWEQ